MDATNPNLKSSKVDGKSPIGINEIGITPNTLQGFPVLTSSLQGINCRNREPHHKSVGQYSETISDCLCQARKTCCTCVMGTASLLLSPHEHRGLFPRTEQATSVPGSILPHCWRRESALRYYMLYFTGYYLIMFFPGQTFFTFNRKARQHETWLVPKHASSRPPKCTTKLYSLDGQCKGTKSGLINSESSRFDMGLNFTAPQLINGTEWIRSQELYTAR